MTAVFADSFYFFALLNPGDPYHVNAVAFSDHYTGVIVTTAWILTELGDGLCQPRSRPAFLRILRQFRDDPSCVLVPATSRWFDLGAQLYEARGDKEWSLTDCISFAVMREHGLADALTGDRHFQQAGFTALLLSPQHD